MEKKDWEEVLKVWNNVKKDAEMSLEQANFFIPLVEAEINRHTE
jgi:hypothetical protein